jgi:hypothetical protein
VRLLQVIVPAVNSSILGDTVPQHSTTSPHICGDELRIAETMAGKAPVFLPASDVDFAHIRGAFSIALHMHQPLIPAGSDDLRAAAIVSNLRFMLEHPQIQDAHNAPVFLSCYQRMGEFIPQLVSEGARPRVMLDYSGCLLHGLEEMGATAVIESLKPLAQDPALRRCVEWLGTAWGHAVAPSTPAQDFRLHVSAWQHHFAATFGPEALRRVRGFSPSEMALPNHPDSCYEFVRTLLDHGYRWVLVQEHSIERGDDGGKIDCPHVPHRLIAHNSRGQSLSIIAIVKTQGSDTKLVGQMQPFYEAKGLAPADLAGRQIPQLVTQIGDGENGGVMMNEFPSKFLQVMREAAHSPTPAMNVTEYLEHLAAIGVREADFPAARPIFQKRLFDRMESAVGRDSSRRSIGEEAERRYESRPTTPDSGNSGSMRHAIEQLHREDDRFHMDGGSWTADISWVRGYENVLGPMEAVSALFAEKVLRTAIATSEPRYRNALFHLLITQTSCFRYWGQGMWTDYGRELCRRAMEILSAEF